MVSAQIDTCINLTVQLTKIADVQGFPSPCNHASYTECYKLITLPGKGNTRLTIALFYILVEWSRWMETVYKKISKHKYPYYFYIEFDIELCFLNKFQNLKI